MKIIIKRAGGENRTALNNRKGRCVTKQAAAACNGEKVGIAQLVGLGCEYNLSQTHPSSWGVVHTALRLTVRFQKIVTHAWTPRFSNSTQEWAEFL